MEERFKKQGGLIIGIVLIGIGVFGLATQDTNKDVASAPGTSAVTSTPQEVNLQIYDNGTVVLYDGVEGVTALEALKANANVVVASSSLGEYVTSINGISDTTSAYWIYYVNGESATVGADAYVMKAGDQIEWRLED